MDTLNRLTISGENIQEVYNWYSNQILIVNRRYQRKLVWTLNEKENLIDTIYNDYPIPLFLLAEIDNKNEIIDGMQRFNAIFDFIENKYSYDEKYFDLDTLATTKDLKDQGKLVQREPLLDRKSCTKIANYKLAISVYKKNEEELINDIFSRINSYGKKLSRQEIRQVGATDTFPTIVRKISEKIRGDATHGDKLALNNMKSISIDIENSSSNTIKATDIYWCKKSILTKNDIRDGEDEALVANIITSIVLKTKYRIANDELDFCYGKPKDSNQTSVIKADDRKQELEVQINQQISSLMDNFFTIFDLIKELDLAFTSKRNYIVLFIAIYQLYFEEEKILSDKQKFLIETKKILQTVTTTKGGVWAKTDLIDNINLVKNTLRPIFKDGIKNRINKEKITEIENIISMSNSESIYYDLKQGFHNLDHNKKFNIKNFEKIMKTICAISNNGKDEDGYILIGIADTEEDKKRIEELYSEEGVSKQVNNHFITGLNGESKEYNSFEDYYKYIANLYEEEKKNFTNLGKSLIESVNYYDRQLFLIKIKSSNQICTYKEKIYHRVGPQTEEASGMQIVSLTERF